METVFLIKIHNLAHGGYYRAGLRLSKGEQVVEVTAAQRAQLETDPRIAILSVSDIQPETADPCGGSDGVMEPELVSGGIGTEAIIPSYYMPVIDSVAQSPLAKPKSNRKKN